jgi:hypothetical protein
MRPHMPVGISLTAVGVNPEKVYQVGPRPEPPVNPGIKQITQVLV